jgi:prepilin-type processing-associated H-X9-DG protein
LNVDGQTRPSSAGADQDNWDKGYGGKISTILCPSDTSKATPNTNEPARNNVIFSIGDYPTGVYIGSDSYIDTSSTFYRGAFGATFRCFGYDGLADGSSNTIMIAETVIGNAVSNSEGNQSTGMIRGDIRIDATGATTNPSLCISTYTSGRQYVTAPGSVRRMFYGRMYGLPNIGTTLFNIILPPNSPSCYSGRSPNYAPVMSSATSNHTNGVNCGFGDGSVHFVTESVNCGTTSSAPVNAGASPYGVWGALGTREGGEAVTYP